MWHEPNTWTVGLLLATGVVLIARHPIAHALGTEVDTAPLDSVTTSTPATHPAVGSGAPALSLPVAAVPTHAPRDPFRALVTEGGKVLAPGVAKAEAPAAVPAPSSPAVHHPTSTPTCSGTTYRVVAGDTLWTLAARAVKSADGKRVTVAWHRLYDANRATLGSDPSLLRVGESLCMPQSL
jgi:nucleoid-associated protein YgaU